MFAKEFSLSDKKALVAGDSMFWTKNVAAALAEAGADVAISTKSQIKLNEAAGEIRNFNRKAVAIAADLTKSSQVQGMVERAVAELGPIDILVNACDLQFAKPFLETTKTEWSRVLDANLTSVFLCCQAVGRHMLENNKRGSIINITSCLAERGVANEGAYCAAMGGVVQITRVLDLEWARSGITVNAVAAGWFSESEKPVDVSDDRLLRYLPMRRYGHPKEIGSLVVYLASDAATYVSGQVMYVDGGVMSHL